jgi:hypothetical protein
MLRVAFAVFISIATAAGGAMAACPDNQPKTQAAKPPSSAKQQPTGNCINLATVPQISAQVVAAEPAPTVKTPAYAEPAAAKYEGPTLGLSKPDPGVRPVPTVGYKWSLQ